MTTTLKIFWHYLVKPKLGIPYDPIIPLLSVDPAEIHAQLHQVTVRAFPLRIAKSFHVY